MLSSPYGGLLHQAAANVQKPQRLHVLYTGLFIDRQEQQKLFERVCPHHVNVTANHVTLAHKPSQVAPTLPLGKGFCITIAGVVADERTQVMSAQLPSELSGHFAGAIPHVTVSYAAGIKAVEAGNLLAEVCSGSDCPVTMEVWHEPLVVFARVAAMLSNGELVFSHERLSEAINVRNSKPVSVQYAQSDATGRQDWQSGGVAPSSVLGAAFPTKTAASPEPALVPLPKPTVRVLSPGQNNTSINNWPSSTTTSPGQDAVFPLNPVSWPCQSEVLLQMHSSAGATAAVSAAQTAVARTMAERELARCLADAERRTAAVHRSARDVFSQAATEAHQQGQRELARELVNKCREHEKLAVEARFRANEAAFDGSNCNLLNRWKVDLHGLHVDEALRVLETHLITLGGLGHPGGILLQVIVGLGRHSVGGVARILPAVVRYLTDAGYNFREEPNNAGVICVLLPGKRNALSGQMNMACKGAY
ncbi:g210 [Coccomyxa elongata]